MKPALHLRLSLSMIVLTLLQGCETVRINSAGIYELDENSVSVHVLYAAAKALLDSSVE